METKTSNYPAWVEAMHKWQEEDKHNRSVICVGVDNPAAALLLSAMIYKDKEESPKTESDAEKDRFKSALKEFISKLSDKL